jgi:hypothetical protein
LTCEKPGSLGAGVIAETHVPAPFSSAATVLGVFITLRIVGVDLIFGLSGLLSATLLLTLLLAGLLIWILLLLARLVLVLAGHRDNLRLLSVGG